METYVVFTFRRIDGTPGRTIATKVDFNRARAKGKLADAQIVNAFYADSLASAYAFARRDDSRRK